MGDTARPFRRSRRRIQTVVCPLLSSRRCGRKGGFPESHRPQLLHNGFVDVVAGLNRPVRNSSYSPSLSSGAEGASPGLCNFRFSLRYNITCRVASTTATTRRPTAKVMNKVLIAWVFDATSLPSPPAGAYVTDRVTSEARLPAASTADTVIAFAPSAKGSARDHAPLASGRTSIPFTRTVAVGSSIVPLTTTYA